MTSVTGTSVYIATIYPRMRRRLPVIPAQIITGIRLLFSTGFEPVLLDFTPLDIPLIAPEYYIDC